MSPNRLSPSRLTTMVVYIRSCIFHAGTFEMPPRKQLCRVSCIVPRIRTVTYGRDQRPKAVSVPLTKTDSPFSRVAIYCLAVRHV